MIRKYPRGATHISGSGMNEIFYRVNGNKVEFFLAVRGEWTESGCDPHIISSLTEIHVADRDALRKGGGQ